MPACGVASLVPQGIEDLWKAAGQVAGNVNLIFYSSAEPCGCQQGRPLSVSRSNSIDNPGIALGSCSRSGGHVFPSVLAGEWKI